MNIYKLLVLASMSVATSAFASGGAAPQPDPTPAPAPTPQPAPVDPTLGSRYATLKGYFDAATEAATLNDLPDWDDLKNNVSNVVCTEIARGNPNNFDQGYVLARVRPPKLNAGPLFPGETANKALKSAVAHADHGSWYTEAMVANELWDRMSVGTTDNALDVVESANHTLVRKAANYITYQSFEVYGSGERSNESYGYCYPASQANPLANLK